MSVSNCAFINNHTTGSGGAVYLNGLWEGIDKAAH